MKVVSTIPGRSYAVECVGEVTVTNTETGAIVAQGDGSGQVFFTACAGAYTVSDDAAVLVVSTFRGDPGAGTASGAAVVEEVLLAPAGAAEDNFNSYGFVCVVSRSGKITQLDIECRHSGSAAPADTPIYTKIWRGTTELLARSTNAQTHAIEATLTYMFEPFEVAEGDELRVTYHTEDGMETTSYQMGQIVCQRAVALTEGESGGMLNSQGGFSSQSYVAKYVWHLAADRFAPAEHVTDSTAHISAGEHAGLAELLARKDELLGLLNG